MSSRLLPTFIGIGAQRAGTTWIHNCLAEHPQVFMTTPKELHFFYLNYARGLDWYADHFTGAAGAPARGEITPDYMYKEEALQNIAKDLPDVKLFVVLRNPIERTISAISLGHERYAGLGVLAACRMDPGLIERGRYCQYLDLLYRYFPEARVKVMFYDDLKSDPAGFLDELYAYIGVDQGFRPRAMGTRYNRIMYPRTQRVLKQLRMGWVVDLVKRSALGDWLRHSHAARGGYEQAISKAEWCELSEIFRSDVQNLSARTGRDLRAWLAPAGAE